LSASDLAWAMPSATDALTPHVTMALWRGKLAYISLMSARVIWCGGNCVGRELGCILAEFVIELDDDDIIDGVEKATVANLAAGAAMNAARSVLKDVDLMMGMN